MKKKLIMFLDRSSSIVALELAIAASLSYLASLTFGQHFLDVKQPMLGALWSAISAILVVQASNQEALFAGWLRIVGSAIGALVIAVMAAFLGYTMLALVISLLITVIACSLCGLATTFRLACVTILVIMVTGKVLHIQPWVNSLIRLAESIFGVLVAILVVYLLNPLQNWVLKKSKEC